MLRGPGMPFTPSYLCPRLHSDCLDAWSISSSCSQGEMTLWVVCDHSISVAAALLLLTVQGEDSLEHLSPDSFPLGCSP